MTSFNQLISEFQELLISGNEELQSNIKDL